ncbi:unnamed protein product [Sphagnum balticum]
MGGELQRMEERYCRQHEQLLASIVDSDSQDGVVSACVRSTSLRARIIAEVGAGTVVADICSQMAAKTDEVASLKAQLTDVEGLREQLADARLALEREQHTCEQLKTE